MEDVARTLEDEGVASFSKSFDELIQKLTRQGQRPVGARLKATSESTTPRPCSPRLRRRRRRAVARRATSSANRLGWLEVPRRMAARPRTSPRGRPPSSSPPWCCSGMGGSSLGPAVLEAVPPPPDTGRADGRRLVVCDTTHPETVSLPRLLRRLRPGVVEVGHHAGAQRRSSTTPGRSCPIRQRYAVITDPGTPLAALATERELQPLLREPTRHRRPLLGALLLRHGARRAHRVTTSPSSVRAGARHRPRARRSAWAWPWARKPAPAGTR